MKTSAEMAMRRFDSIHVLLRDTRVRLAEEWMPDPPPLTILWSAYAHTLADHNCELSDSDKKMVFSAIEDFLDSGDDELSAAVATGFLEALQARASAGLFDFAAIKRYMGERTVQYCRAWDRFTGTSTRGL